MKKVGIKHQQKKANYNNQDWESNKVVECYITTLAQFKIENEVFFLFAFGLI